MVQSVASHAPPTQLSPGGDRADIWGEGEERGERKKEGSCFVVIFPVKL